MVYLMFACTVAFPCRLSLFYLCDEDHVLNHSLISMWPQYLPESLFSFLCYAWAATRHALKVVYPPILPYFVFQYALYQSFMRQPETVPWLLNVVICASRLLFRSIYRIMTGVTIGTSKIPGSRFEYQGWLAHTEFIEQDKHPMLIVISRTSPLDTLKYSNPINIVNNTPNVAIPNPITTAPISAPSISPTGTQKIKAHNKIRPSSELVLPLKMTGSWLSRSANVSVWSSMVK